MSTIYRKEEVLGWGSVAAVHKGWDELLDRPVAIKELKQPFAGNEPFSRAFRTQALRMLDLSHRHVLATYAVDSDRNVHSVIREVADETVGQRSFHGPMEPGAVLKILRAALLGLDVLHGRDLLHRAVKPDNIFLCKDTYKIGDFGLPSQEGAPPVPVGRYRYSAPEEIQQSELVSRESDLYSLGIVAYELILGSLRLEQVLEELLRTAGLLQKASSSGSRDDLWPQFHVSTIELPPLIELDPGVPAALSLTLKKMVAKDMGSRFTSCRQVLSSLGSATPEFPTGTQGVTIIHETAPTAAPSSGNWAWIAGGALAVSAILALAIWGLASRQTQAGHPPSEESTSSQMFTAPDSVPSQIPSPPSETGDSTNRLMALLSPASDTTIALDPPRSGVRPVLALGSPLGFRITSRRSGQLLLFVLSSNGTITCIYPNADRPFLTIDATESLTLPSSAERQRGLDLIASQPLGREIVFLLHSPAPLPPLPESESSSSPLSEYEDRGETDDPASRFVDWISNLLQERPGARLMMTEFEVAAAQ